MVARPPICCIFLLAFPTVSAMFAPGGRTPPSPFSTQFPSLRRAPVSGSGAGFPRGFCCQLKIHMGPQDLLSILSRKGLIRAISCVLAPAAIPKYHEWAASTADVSHSSGGRKSKSRVPAWPRASSAVRTGQRASSPASHQDAHPTTGLHTQNLIIASQRPRLRTASHWDRAARANCGARAFSPRRGAFRLAGETLGRTYLSTTVSDAAAPGATCSRR